MLIMVTAYTYLGVEGTGSTEDLASRAFTIPASQTNNGSAACKSPTSCLVNQTMKPSKGCALIRQKLYYPVLSKLVYLLVDGHYSVVSIL